MSACALRRPTSAARRRVARVSVLSGAIKRLRPTRAGPLVHGRPGDILLKNQKTPTMLHGTERNERVYMIGDS
jgi:hypothetical protein